MKGRHDCVDSSASVFLCDVAISPGGKSRALLLLSLPILCVLVAASGCNPDPPPPSPPIAQTSERVIDASIALREAVTLRALGIESPGAIESLLTTMPIGTMGRDAESSTQRQLAWSTFFRGTLLKLGQLKSSTPLALHYNPLIDVAVVQACQLAADALSLSCTELCALPGEALSSTPPAAEPAWMSETDPLTALTQLAAVRTGAFAKAHPADSSVGAPWRERYCKADLQSIAELRILQGMLSTAEVDSRALGGAVAAFLKRTGTPERQPVSEVDAEVRGLLANLSALSLAGAVSTGDGGWLLFFTPKRSGWRQVVLVVGRAPKQGLELKGAKVLSISSEVKS